MKKTGLVLLLACAIGAPAWADGPPDTDKINIAEIVAKAAGGAEIQMGAAEPALPKFEDVTKGMTSAKGLFTLWCYPADTKDKDTEKLLCQIPASFLGEKFMLSTSFSGGGFFTGFPLDERVVQWELRDRQVVLVEPQTQYVVDQGQTVSDVVRRTYPERIRATVPLLTKSPSGDPVIDFGTLLKSDFADIAWMSGFGLPMLSGGGINASLSKWTKKKTFELNCEIGVELAIGSASPPGSYDKKMVHFSFWKLPQTDYTPRIADDRVGYFLTANRDWAKPTESRDLFNRYIDRWHLVKRDPSLATCEPRQPILFFIEKTVPVRFRRAVRDGILEWNKAYEKIGFASAVEVRQQTDDNEWRDLDPEDMRYSFFRWIVTGGGFAMGPHRANPFTGQIYDADIVFDDSMVRYFEQEAEQMLPSAAYRMKFSDPVLREFVQTYPQWARTTRPWETFAFGLPHDQKLIDAMRERMRDRGHHCCDYADGMKHQMALGAAVLAGQPKEVIDRYLYDIIKEVVMHEVGHTLGLRHNFKASSIWPLDEIRKRRAQGLSTTGSVMDYNPALLFHDKALDGHFVTPTIGPYDYWAIEYGYRPADGSLTDGEKAKSAADAGKPQAKKEEPKKAPPTGVTGVQPVNLDAIPKEVLEKLPPEVRKMIESGAVQIATGSEIGGGAPTTAGPAVPSFAGANPAETAMLAKIASRAAEPELAYATDEDTTFIGPDPRTNRFDLGADPVDWARTRIELVDKRMNNILEWAVKDQESWYHLRNAFVRLVIEKAFVLDYVGRYVGGQYTSRSHRGDPNGAPPFQLVDTKTQRAALGFIQKHLYSDEFFGASPEVLNHLASPRWWHAGSSIDFTVDFPYYELIGVMQWWNLFDRFYPNTLRRIHDGELKTASTDKFTVVEYIQGLQSACWENTTDADRATSEKWTDEAPFITSIRRSLQREYLNVVEPLVRTPPGQVLSPDLHAIVQHALRTLAGKIDRVLATKSLDFASEAHLTACKSRIERMLAPELNEQRGGGPVMF